MRALVIKMGNTLLILFVLDGASFQTLLDILRKLLAISSKVLCGL